MLFWILTKFFHNSVLTLESLAGIHGGANTGQSVKKVQHVSQGSVATYSKCAIFDDVYSLLHIYSLVSRRHLVTTLSFCLTRRLFWSNST